MEEIIRFVILAQSARYSFTELCLQFGISRKTGYKHLARYAAAGLPNGVPHSRGQALHITIDGMGGRGRVEECRVS